MLNLLVNPRYLLLIRTLRLLLRLKQLMKCWQLRWRHRNILVIKRQNHLLAVSGHQEPYASGDRSRRRALTASSVQKARLSMLVSSPPQKPIAVDPAAPQVAALRYRTRLRCLLITSKSLKLRGLARPAEVKVPSAQWDRRCFLPLLTEILH